MNKKIKQVGVLLGVMISGFASADDYLRDQSTGEVVRSGTGLCWRTGYWTPAGAIKECDPEYFPEKKNEKQIMKISADVLFKFNSAQLSEQGRKQLSELLKNVPTHSTMEVVGHTDRIGSAQYNIKLSQERANTVSKYLQSQRASLNVVSKGVGFSEPSGETSQCKGTKATKKLIDCLAPDRRVIISIE